MSEVKSKSGRALSEMPQSHSLVVSSKSEEINAALASVGKSFSHIEVIQASPCSGRLLLQQRTDRSVSLNRSMTPQDVGFELYGGMFQLEARYNPPTQPDTLYEKGWEIRRVEIDGQPAALALAAWVRKVSA